MQKRWLRGIGVAVAIAFGALVAWPSLNPLRQAPKPRPAPRAAAPPPHPAAETPREHDRKIASSRPEAPEGAPNLVLVFGCTVRKDQTSIHSDLDTTPYLKSIAEAGATFDDALAVSSWTRASAVGVLTGEHPLALGLPEPGPKQSERMLPLAATTLAEHLAAAGWLTVGGTGNPNLNAVYGMAQGMDRYRDSFPKAFRKGRQSGKRVVKEALAVLDSRTEVEKQRPFYLQLMLIDAHHPRHPEPLDLGAFRSDGVPLTLVRYRASLRLVDRAVKQLDRGLAKRGYTPENTVFVFVTDHGEGLELPKHHKAGHGKQMYSSTVEIPWVVRGPGVPAGHQISGLASGIDVSPTLLGLLDLHVPPGDGIDHSALLRGATSRTQRTEAFAASMFHVADVASIWTSTQQCQDHYTNDRDKKVGGCFDRVADPDFTNPIPAARLTQRLQARRAELLERGKAHPIKTAAVADDVAEQLKMLGYLEE